MFGYRRLHTRARVLKARPAKKQRRKPIDLGQVG
jgi:hypothetical protein